MANAKTRYSTQILGVKENLGVPYEGKTISKEDVR